MTEPGPLPPIWTRALKVFFAPGRLFAVLRERPRWVGALLLGAVLVTASSAVLPTDIWNEMVRRQLLESGQAGFENAGGGVVYRVGATVGTAVFWVVWSFGVAALVTFVFGLLLGDGGRYRQYLAVVTHASLIAAVGALLTVPLRIVQRDPQLTLNLGLFLPLAEGYLLNLLTMLDLFLLWSYVVIAIGVHEIDRRRSVGSAALLMLGFAVVMAAGVALMPL